MAGIFLDTGATAYNVVNNGDMVFGSTGTETVTLGSSVTNVRIDANAEQVNFAGAITEYKFAQAGNVLKVYSGSTLVAEVVTDGSSLVSFNSGSAVALAIRSGTMSIDGNAIGATPAALTAVASDATELDTAINGSLTALNVTGSIDASTKDLSQFTAGITVAADKIVTLTETELIGKTSLTTIGGAGSVNYGVATATNLNDAIAKISVTGTIAVVGKDGETLSISKTDLDKITTLTADKDDAITLTGATAAALADDTAKLTVSGTGAISVAGAANENFTLAKSVLDTYAAVEATGTGTIAITGATAAALADDTAKLTVSGTGAITAAFDGAAATLTQTAFKQTFTTDGVLTIASDVITVTAVTVSGGDFEEAATIDLLDTSDVIAFDDAAGTLTQANFKDVFTTQGMVTTVADVITVTNVTTASGDFAEAATIDLLDTSDIITFDSNAGTLAAANYTDVFETQGILATSDDTITVNTLNGATLAGTAATDVFDFANADAGVVITTFDSGSADKLNVSALLDSGSQNLLGSAFEAYDGAAAATDNKAVLYTAANAAISVSDVEALFEDSASDSAVMELATDSQTLLFNQYGTDDVTTQIYLVTGVADNTEDTIVLVGTITADAAIVWDDLVTGQ